MLSAHKVSRAARLGRRLLGELRTLGNAMTQATAVRAACARQALTKKESMLGFKTNTIILNARALPLVPPTASK